MNRLTCCVVVCTCLLGHAAVARGELLISAGSFSASPGGMIDIPVMISGSDPFANVALAFSVGDGGSAFGGGTETIAISSVDYISGPTVWDTFSLNTSEGVPLPATSATIANVGITPANTNTTATNSLLMTFTLDLSSVDNNRIGEILALNLNAGGLTDVSGSSGTNPVFSLSPGMLSIVGEPSPGDFDADGRVDHEDLAAWQNGYGTPSGAAVINGDADRDFDVDGIDFLQWQRGFGTASGGAVTSLAVPEPGTWTLAMGTLFLSWAIGRNRSWIGMQARCSSVVPGKLKH